MTAHYSSFIPQTEEKVHSGTRTDQIKSSLVRNATAGLKTAVLNYGEFYPDKQMRFDFVIFQRT